MSVLVLNNDANVSGKTLLLAENADTITGLKTFDRDPSAPFAVSASSAVVTNLDADKLDGLDGSGFVRKVLDLAWTTYVPAWTNTGTANTLGNGVITGQHISIGKVVFFKIAFTWGSSSVGGNGFFLFSLPSTAVLNVTNECIGVGMIKDSGTGDYVASVVTNSTTTVYLDNGNTISTGATTSVPMVWATGDYVSITGLYRVA